MNRSFPFYHQLDAMDCGATCLRMVARYYGRFYSLDYLRELTYLGKQGVNLLSISDAAENLGLQTLPVKTTVSRLISDLPLPCIAHWKSEQHFVVIYRANSKFVWIADPAAGRFKLPIEEFVAQWASDVDMDSGEPVGVLLLLETTPDFFARDKQKVNKAGFGYILSYFGRYGSLITQLALGLLLGTIIQLVLPFLFKAIVDVGINNVDPNFIRLIIIGLAVLFVSQIAVELFRSWIILHVGVRVNIRLVSDFLIKLTRLPLRFFETKLTGDLLQRIADHERVQRFLTSTSLISIFSLVTFVAFAFVLAFWNLDVFFIFLAGTALTILWVVLFGRWRRETDYKQFDQYADNQGSLIELIGGMRDIKLHQAEKQKRWAWERVQSQLFRTSLDVTRIDQFQRSGAALINEGKNLLITAVVAYAVVDNRMTLGMLVAIQYIVGQLNSPINRVVEFVRALQEAKISLERMSEIHDKPGEESEGDKITLLPESGDLVLERVSFQYDGPHSSKVLRNIDLRIPKGKTTALVGTSGSGKTTLIKLLLHFYEPTEGFVRLGDISLRNLDSNIWRRECGAVLQEGYIFQDTIARNIALGDDIIDKEKLLRAVKTANIQTYIESLPLGYNTVIGREGQGLSQGQKQRLLIARMVYKEPAYIFLDEATTALDPFNEMLIMENLRDVFRGNTIVLVAHRVSTIMDADNIVVLEDGEIVEQGNHEELTYVQGAYYQLVRNQTELGG